jgi:hypothetical protein
MPGCAVVPARPAGCAQSDRPFVLWLVPADLSNPDEVKKGVIAMPSQQYTRSTGKRLTYLIAYDKGEYFIERDGLLKKAVPDAMATGISPSEATPKLMLKLAIGDIESLNGMEE